MRARGLFAIACLGLALPIAVRAGDALPGRNLLDPLIGAWDVSPPDAAPAFIERFSFGPQRAYVWVRVSFLRTSEEEHLHFEGIAVWNAATGRHDYLFAVEPGSGVQERGEFHVTDDGLIVRDVTLTAADGKIATFRQTFRDLGDGRFETSLMRKTADGWIPTFPRSERLIMVRRTS